jgi:hypothetical protein
MGFVLDPDQDHPVYEELWRHAFTPRRSSGAARIGRAVRVKGFSTLVGDRNGAALRKALVDGRHRVRLGLARILSVPASPSSGATAAVVKSVAAHFTAEWIVERFSPRVVVVLRHPFNAVSSRLQLGWGPRTAAGILADPRAAERFRRSFGLDVPPVPDSPLGRQAWQVGLLTSLYEAIAARHPDWVVVTHEDMCVNPVDSFRALSQRVGLGWSDRAAEEVLRSNRPGSGYETNRVASGLADRWRERFAPQEIEEMAAILRRFPIRTWEALV